jgi:hypothetical protein
MKTRMARFLLISRVGPKSRHSEWISSDSARNFDVFLSAYSAEVDIPSGPGIQVEFRAGQKVAGFSEIFQEHAAMISTYDYVALFDDDLSASPQTISELFDICAARNLKIAQPALTHDSYFSYAGVLQQPGFELRHMTFVEMMAPVFRRDVLQQVRPLFELGFESGIDLIWCNQCFEAPDNFAVIDACAVRHTNPVGAQMAQNGFVGARIYEDDIHSLLDRFDLPWLPCLPYSAITQDGRRITSRIALMFHALRLAGALSNLPGDPGRLRKVLTHWKHLALARPNNIHPVQYSKDAQVAHAGP